MAEIEFRLLGPLEVWRDGRRLEVAGAKPRALLALLLLRVGEVVSVDRLIDGLWGERAPASGVNALQQHVTALRRALEPARPDPKAGGVLMTCAPGYVLQVPAEAVDVCRFERLLDEGREALAAGDPDRAAGLLREALELWRGPALAEFIYDPFAAGEAERLEELRLGALEKRLEADLMLGRHADVVAELEALVVEHPLREQLAGQLMLALYRCGRQADASEVFHAIRSRLVEELGMEPGASLRRLLQRILEQDPSLELAPATPVAALAPSPPRPPHNLPIELTSFVGRERELAEVRSLLSDTRLLTLTGAGGSGKTRLALRAAREVADRYSDGVWLVELAPLADPALVAAAVATAVGVRQQSGSLVDALRRRLESAQLLIVLDNCEHLIDACAELAHALLTGCERVRIVATSREPLAVAGEVTWPVPPLELPELAQGRAPEELNRSPAVRLFAERAAAARPAFKLDRGNAEAVALLCARLDGIPLAIELAAARVRTLAPAEILHRLDDRFRVLSGGTRDALPRQRTLRATLDWSHELLNGPERTLFRRLSVFAGGFTAADVEQVCVDRALPTADVLDVLFELLAKSLVVVEPADLGATRYRMLDTVRDYAAERLAAAGEQEPIGAAHVAHFLRFAELAHQQRRVTGLTVEFQTLAAQRDNLRAALACARANEPEALLRLAAALEQLWLGGHVNEGRQWLREALTLAPAPTRDRVRALNAAAALACLGQARDEGGRLLEESLALSAQLGDPDGDAGTRLWLAFRELTSDSPPADDARRSLALHEAVGDTVGACRSLLFLGIALSVNPKDREASRDALERAVQLAREVDDGWAEAFARMFLGNAALDAGDRELAISHFRAGLLTEMLGPVRGNGLDGFARLALDSDPRRAIRLLGASRALRERYGGRPPPWLKRKAQAIQTEAERRLDARAFKQAWEEGLAMSTEQAITYAFEELGPPDELARRRHTRMRARSE